MRVPDIAIACSIALLYPLFFRKLADVVLNAKELDKTCGSPMLSIMDFAPKNNGNEKECNDKRMSFDTKRFAIMLLAGLGALASSYFVNSPALSMGLGIAGVVANIDATVGYWYNMNDMIKMIMVGIALFALLMSPKIIAKYSHTVPTL